MSRPEPKTQNKRNLTLASTNSLRTSNLTTRWRQFGLPVEFDTREILSTFNEHRTNNSGSILPATNSANFLFAYIFSTKHAKCFRTLSFDFHRHESIRLSFRSNCHSRLIAKHVHKKAERLSEIVKRVQIEAIWLTVRPR